MILLFRRIFTPPAFADDENKTRAAVILHWILWLILGLVVAMAPFIFRFYSAAAMPISAVSSALAGPVSFICLLLLVHRGHVRLASWALVLFQWMSTLFQVVVLGGLSGPAASGYVVAILLAGTLLGSQAALLFLGLSVLSLFGLDYAVMKNWMPDFITDTSENVQIIMMANTLVSAWVILSLVMDSQKSTLKKIDANARKLEIERGALQTINQIGRAVVALGDLEAVLRLAREEVERNLPLDVFFVALYDPEKQKISFPLVYEHGVNWNEPDTDINPETNLSKVLTTGEPILRLIRPEELESFRKKPRLLLGDLTQISASLIYVPLRSSGEISGVLSVQSYQHDAYSEQDLRLLEGVATQIMIAIENARLFASVQVELAERKRAEDEVRRLNDGLEQRVSERTRELQSTYRELESFSYTISHDLRAPLRALDGYSRILQEDYAANLDEQAAHYLQRIRGRAQYMGQLIDDLLAFSRLGRQPLRIRCISTQELTEMIGQVIADMSADIATREVNVQVGWLPNVDADAVLFRQVWVNLISNAFKFTRFKEQGRIEIGCRETSRGLVYFISDNGAGFDMEYAAKLFGVFQRLHRYEEFEGTGVGLAIVKRIIERHGGSVWAEGQVDQGATFYFTLENCSEIPPVVEMTEPQITYPTSSDGLE